MMYFLCMYHMRKHYVSYRICGTGYGVEDKWMTVLFYASLKKLLH